MMRIPSPATMTVGNDLSFYGTSDDASSTGSSARTWAFNLTWFGPTHFPLVASGLSPAPQLAQVPNHVMIWFELH